MTMWWLFPLVFTVAVLLTGAVRRYALARSLLDIPNARSSHTAPTPRGGGMAIVASFVAATLVLAAIGQVPGHVALALGGSGMLVATVGFIDDHGGLRARWRLVAHFAAAAWGLYWLGGMPAPTLFGVGFAPGWPGQAIAVVALVWLLNLYNFMDGIDGLAGIEAVTVGLGATLLCLLAGEGAHAVLPSVLALAAAGFLCWNYPPAKIFMGDAGSGFIGLVLGLLVVDAAGAAPGLLWGWLILLGVFVVDATITLLRRVVRGEPFHQAHRSHAYQHASRRWRSHKRVSLAAAAINLLWLLPLAALVVRGWMEGVLALMLAYAPLVWLALRFDAGAPDRHDLAARSGVR